MIVVIPQTRLLVFTSIISALLLSSCANIITPEYYYNEIIIHNKTKLAVSNATIRVEKTHAVFQCSYIPSGSQCSNKFPKRKFLGNPIQVSWTFNNRTKISDSFVLQIPAGFDPAIPMQGILNVTSPEEIEASLRQ